MKTYLYTESLTAKASLQKEMLKKVKKTDLIKALTQNLGIGKKDAERATDMIFKTKTLQKEISALDTKDFIVKSITAPETWPYDDVTVGVMNSTEPTYFKPNN